MIKKILITGSNGQIGTELSGAFRKIYGDKNVICSDLNLPNDGNDENFEQLDVLDYQKLRAIVEKHDIDAIIHLAALLSAVGEKNPALAWNINMGGTMNVFEVAREKNIKRIFVPSSIGAFGPSTPKVLTGQDVIMQPSTMYGITKVAGELLGEYYVNKFGLDIRGLRFPGIISYLAQPGGGTTDYAVQIYFDAVKYGKYECFLSEDTELPMMYMPDCIKSVVDLFHADFNNLKHHSGFNLAAFSVTPKIVAESIKKFIPDFEITYKPDFRQQIADSWPKSIDDSAARTEWNWKPQFDLDTMTKDMLDNIKA